MVWTYRFNAPMLPRGESVQLRHISSSESNGFNALEWYAYRCQEVGKNFLGDTNQWMRICG